eukprot:COSAG02_NODE_4716_length_5060_cov_2.509978_3_plen_74_part_00
MEIVRASKRRKVTRSKTHGCTNRLAWLRAMDPDAFSILMTQYVCPHAIFRVALREIPWPARFLKIVKDHGTHC